MEVFLTLVGVIIGGLITYFVERWLQDREFKKENHERREVMKCYLETLKAEIADDYQRLWNLRNQVYGKGYPTEYFDVTVKQNIMSEIIKTPLYGKYKKIFDRINSMAIHLIVLNHELAGVRDFIKGKYCSALDQEAKIHQQIDQAVSVINNILNQNIQESNSKCEICIRLEEIIKTLV